MKVYLHYHNKTNEVYVSVVDNILQADELFKSKFLKPLDFITTGFVISKETPSSEKRFFSGLIKDQRGNPIVDDFGSLVRYEEWRNVLSTLVEKQRIDEPGNLYTVLHDSGPWCEDSINDENEFFVVYGNNKIKLHFHTYRQIMACIYNTNKPRILEIPGEFGKSLFSYVYKG